MSNLERRNARAQRLSTGWPPLPFGTIKAMTLNLLKRPLVAFIVLLAVGIVGAAGVTTRLVAFPPESEDLVFPVMSPAVITPDIPTFVTFTVDFSQDPNLKSPKLQVFDPARGEWKTVAKLSDKGKFEDPIKKDRIYNLRVRFLDANGTTQIHRPRNGKLNLRWEGTTPLQLRLAAKKKGQKGIITSPAFSIPTIAPAPIVVGGGAGDPPASVEVPATFDPIDPPSDPNNVVLKKSGPDGYQVEVRIRSNASALPLEQWVLVEAFDFTDPQDPQTLSDYDRGASVPLMISGLNGFKITEEALQESIQVFLDDPANGRVFWFVIFATDADQNLRLEENLPEALSVVLSLQP